MGADIINQILNAGAAALMAVFYLIGLYLTGAGLIAFYKKQDPYASRSNPISSPFWTFFAGVILLISEGFYNTTMNSFADNESSWDQSGSLTAVSDAAIMQIQGNSGGDLFSYIPESTLQMIAGMIYLFGLYAYLKGIYLFRYAGDGSQGGQPSPFSKATAHFFGGLIVMNLFSVSCAFSSLFFTVSYCN